MEAAILEYFTGERLGGVTLSIIGGAAVAAAIVLAQARWDLRPMAIVIGVLALLQLAVGVGLVVRTGPQVSALLALLADDPTRMIAEESARMARVQRTFVTLHYVWIGLFAASAAAAVAFKGRPAIWGASLGLVLQTAVMFVFDQVAERRGATYHDTLTAATTVEAR